MMILIRPQQRGKIQIFRNAAMVRKQNGLLEKPSIGKYLVHYNITTNDIGKAMLYKPTKKHVSLI